MGRFEQVREAMQRALEASRESLRAAKERAEAPDGDYSELTVTAESPSTAQQPSSGEDAATGPSDAPPGGQPDAPPGGQPDAPPGGQPGAPPARPVESATRPDSRATPIEESVPRSLRIAGAWSWRLIVIAAVGWGVLWIANQYLLLVAPLMIGLLLAGLLMPAQRGLLRMRIHRSLAALLVMIGGLGVVGGTLYLVVVAFIDGLDEMVGRIEQGVVEIEIWLRNGPFQMDDAALEDLVTQGQAWLEENAQDLLEQGLTAVTGTVQFLTGMILVIVITFFFLRDGGRIWRFLVSMLPAAAKEPMAYAGEGAWRSLSGYVRATVLVALVDAIGIGLGLLILSWTMNIPAGLVLPLAALVFLGGFVPIVGAFVSGFAAVMVGLVTGETPAQGLLQALIVLGIVIVVQQVESNILQPFIVSKMVRIHPLAVIIAVMAGILLAGIIGALVAVPTVAVLNTVVRRLHHFRQARRPLPPPADVAVAPPA